MSVPQGGAGYRIGARQAASRGMNSRLRAREVCLRRRVWACMREPHTAILPGLSAAYPILLERR